MTWWKLLALPALAGCLTAVGCGREEPAAELGGEGALEDVDLPEPAVGPIRPDSGTFDGGALEDVELPEPAIPPR